MVCNSFVDDNGTPADLSDDTFVPIQKTVIMTAPQRIKLLTVAAPGQIVDIRVQRYDADGNPVFYQDSVGDNILDDGGNPIPVTDPVTLGPNNPVARSMIDSNAAGSGFFNVMDNSVGASVDHSLFMSADELRLISEWLDIGAQYYNNPFDAP